MHARWAGLTFIVFYFNMYVGQAQLLSVVQHEGSNYRDAIIRVNAVPGSTATNNYIYNGTVLGIYGVAGGSGTISPGGSALVNGLPPGNYTFQILSDLGLSTESITIHPFCNFPLFNNDVFYYECNNQVATFSVPITGITSPATFYWKTPNGDFSSTSAVVTGPPGKYEVTVVDAVGCIESDALTIHNLEPINISCSSTPATPGESNGSIQFTFTGGQAPYDVEIYGPVFKYFHYNSAGTYTISNLPSGSFEIYVFQVDYLLCDDPCEVKVLEKTCNLNLSNQQISHIKCIGTKNGSITLSPSNGTAPYQFLWSNGRTTSAISNLSGGNYSVTVNDANACSSTTTLIVLEPGALELAATKIAPPTCKGKDGILTIKPFGGTTPYRYAWSNGATTSSLTNLSGGSYTLTVTDANQCSLTGSWTLLNATLPLYTSTVTPIPCLGGRGAIVINLSSPATQVKWPDGSTLKNRDQLLPGTYQVTISEGAACAEVLEFVLVEPPLLALQCALISHQTTQNGKEGQINVTVSGGTPPYRLSLTGPKVLNPNLGFTTAYSFKDLTAGTYTLSVSDSRGCSASCGAIIIEARLCTLSLTTVAATEVSCFGARDGSVKINAAGSNSLSYILKGPNGYNQQQNQSTFSSLAPGPYFLTVQDPIGCMVTAEVQIKEPPALVLTCLQTPLSHVDSADASINYSWSGGVAPYTLIWTGGGADQIIPAPQAGQQTRYHLAAATYLVTVKDNRGCTDTCQQTIADITCTLSADLLTQPACAGQNAGKLDLLVQSTSPSLTYQWLGPHTLQGAGPFSGLPDGNYAVTVTDRQGCTTTRSTLLESWPVPDISCSVFSHQRTVNGREGALLVKGTAGHTVQMINQPGFMPRTISPSTGQVIIDQLQPGSYDLLVTSPQGCSAQCSAEINPKLCTITATAEVQHLSCADAQDGTLRMHIAHSEVSNVLITGPTSTTWTLPELSRLAAGLYQYQVNDGAGCILTGTAEIKAPPPLRVAETVQEPTDTLHPNGVIALSPSGGQGAYRVLWNTGSQEFFLSKLSAGTFAYTVTDQAGCQYRDTIVLSLTGAARCSGLTIQSLTNPASCPQARDGMAEVLPSGGELPYAVSWSTGVNQSLLSQLSAGKYTVTVTDQLGCLALAEIEIIAQPAPQQVMEKTLCPGLDLVVHGQVFRQAGNYLLTLPGQVCDTTLSLTVKAPPLLEQVKIETSRGDFCGQPNRLRFQQSPPGATFSLDGGQTWTSNPEHTGLPDGAYSLLVSQDGCVFQLGQVELTAYAFKEIQQFQISSPLSCSDQYGSITLFIPDAPGWTWQLNAGLWQPELRFDSLLPGEYKLRGRIKNSTCIQDFGQVLKVETAPPTDLNISVEAVQPSCPGGQSGLAQISVSGGVGAYTIRWDQGQLGPVLAQVPAGEYQVTVTDEEGCQQNRRVTIAEQTIRAPLEDTSIVLCPGNLVQLHLDTTYTYNWSGPESFTYQGPEPELYLEGPYQVTFTDRAGCSDQRSVELIPSKKAFLVNFLVPAVALAGTEIKAVENSWPIPDSITWWVDEGIDIVSMAYNTLSFSGADAGAFKIGLRSYYQGCLLELTKTVRFTDDPAQAVIDPSTVQTTIKSLTIAPNPNSGQFTLRIELNSPLGLQLRIYDPAGQLAMSKYFPQSRFTSLSEEIVLDQPVSGIYSLSLQSASEWRTWSFIVLR